MRATTLIITVVAFLGVTSPITATACTVTSPTCGIIVVVPPTDFQINLSGPVDPTSVQASDLTVNGTPADSFVLLNGNTTITFHFNTSPVVGADNTMYIPAGAFDCGPPVDFNCTFTFNGIRPTPPPRPHPAPRPRPTPSPARFPCYNVTHHRFYLTYSFLPKFLERDCAGKSRLTFRRVLRQAVFMEAEMDCTLQSNSR